MDIGFTGTRNGMNNHQYKKLRLLLVLLTQGNESHACRHGDCIGADKAFHGLCSEQHLYVIVHPPVNEAFRAFCSANETLPAKDYLVRNQDIVQNSDVIIATPKEMTEITRSGTWATIRFARQSSKRVFIIYPDGKIDLE